MFLVNEFVLCVLALAQFVFVNNNDDELSWLAECGHCPAGHKPTVT